ncbi:MULTISPECIES: TetR/AcrR family transcriptional regulator [Agrobacterium]|uniref:TetR/AcrR family transcriptional regulator n=1 Tax=Agrobacterium tumefaciens TaxID=358 RepID=A0AAE6BGF4_AGRTU|nr:MULTISPECIES: TetR/AcrR family transcriptional regulator [Agrobacterium]QCL76899.1 TetR/AcrR family transcriptional regulator [Agrobacterium tumefaciens]QCL82405.1 TetR/AcrR family transcriptional regulator [Agrobacterium tumefaciens]CUX70672.1 putative TetR family transcriptional regulator [Agrobacterium sp. NCPPB 925]
MSNLSTTSDDILASTRHLLISGGYNGFSYADISEIVGIRKASIHHHFPSKVDLVRELVKRYREDGQASVAILEQKVPNALDILKTYANHWAACIEDASRPYCVCAMLASELPSLPTEVATEVTNFFRFISSWLTSVMERGSKQGELSLTSAPHVEAETFLATIYGAMLSARANGKPEVFSMILEPALDRLTPTVSH